mmetsp:Transcript_24997/g.74250  ORF Transcript_24997/g.74250 Transcript_24997/m.74250 type:complete len:4444 (+) Transcript_24997:3-13334(+)
MVDAFLNGESSGHLLFYSQAGEVFLTNGSSQGLTGKCAYFVRVTDGKVNPAKVEEDVNFGTLEGSSLVAMSRMISEVFCPAVATNTFGFSKRMKPAELAELQDSNSRCVEVLGKAIESLTSGLELAPVDTLTANSAAAISAAAANPAVAKEYEDTVLEWCEQTERLLGEKEDTSADGDGGPRTELDYWRGRMAKLNSVIQQLNSERCRVVLSVLQVAKSRALKRWKVNDNAITDAANEAKDNVKYLHTLDKYIDPLYNGTPAAVVESLPGLLNNIKMMNTIARYYSTQRMTTLFRKVTEQMIANCRAFVEAGGGSLWEQPTLALIARLRSSIDCNRQYQEQYRAVRDALAENPSSKQFDFNENAIFGKFDLFCRRVEKLIDMFSTVEQFTTLSDKKLEGLEGLMASFFALVADFKRKPYDLLDFQMNQFDRDYLEFNANIHELESSLQGFINQSFEHITSTEHALMLLRQFQATLQRESLKDDLESKFLVIFQNYGVDLETVQRLYEKQKVSPPTVRNSPPVTGNVMWARQLMRRIERPMEQFKENPALMATKESKKLIKVYNKIARTIVEFETLWHLAWTKGIEAAKSGLQATLLVRHPNTGRLHVNFDREILQLLRETKCLMRMGQEVPESAKMVLAQEEKFKLHFNLLSHAISEYERVMKGIMPIAEPLLKPHLAELERVIQPGMLSLTWTSMNIEAYLHAFHAELMRFDDLVAKVKDIVENRLLRNLDTVRRLQLITLPVDESFSLDKFVSMQEKHIAEQQAVMVAKNIEVEEGVQDLLALILDYSFTYVDAKPDPADVQRLQAHFSRLMHEAVMECTRASLAAIQRRISARVSTGAFLMNERPFFDVNVELQVPTVVMSPPLSEIQEAINHCSRAVLGCSKSLKMWDAEEASSSAKSVYEVVSKDRETVRVVLLLTGAIEGAKRQVHEYLQTFDKYNFLFHDDKAAAYDAFMAKAPTLEDFECELKKYVAIENEIANVPEKHTIGALSLETAPMKMALKEESQAWKSQYAENLHLQARAELEEITQWINEMTRFLKREVTDLEDVRTAMQYLAQIREKESTLDMIFGPIEEKYALLSCYEVSVPKEETDTVTDLGYSWKKLKKISDDMTERLRSMQSGFRQGLVKNVKIFAVDVVQFRNDFEANGPKVPGLPPMDAYERLRRFQRLYQERARRYEAYNAGEVLFGLPETTYPELEVTKSELELLEKLYGLYTTVLETVTDYNDTSWIDIQEPTTIEMMLKKMEEFQVGCKKMPKDLRSWDAFIELKKTVDDFLETLPLVTQLANPSMRPRHWEKLQEVTGKALSVGSDTFKLSTLLEAGLLEVADDVEDIANSSVKERSIEIKLGELSADWSVRPLTMAQFKNRGTIMLNGGATAELMEALEEAQMALGSMMASRFITPFREEATEWIARLSTISEILEMWLQVQSMWQYLEAVFTSGDIAKQLPQEAKRFQGIDKNWVKIMTKANEVPIALNYIYGNETLKQLLPYMLEQLELCQKALSGYLDQKRAAFPRFFFVADATLLEVLSQGSNPEAIQPHLQSVFDSMVEVVFDRKEKTLIREFKSAEGQTVTLYNPVKAEGNIEEWLDRLLKEMQATMNTIISLAAGDCEVMPTEAFTHKYQAQVSLIGIQFKWTMDSEDALYRAKAERNILKETNKRHNQRLTDLVAINMRPDADLKTHGKWTRKKVETMILVDVHQRDVFDEIFKKRVKDPEDFEWQKQARFYWRHDLDHAQVSVADVDFKYCCEYLGVKDRLVITPLTDRCYITLSQALGMFLGGAPAGPAGTGKTETVKDMGCTLGKYVVVTNCSDQMDYRALGGIYKGLAMSGCWGCFDEFNRIDLEVLSVAAQQVGCVLTAIREQKETFQFTDGHVIACNKEVGYFITMNPGYAGRQELPENLKSLHRGVTMMVPDREIIMKVKLIGSGYVHATMLAKKFNVLYRLCEEQLSKQAHYDFGLRNILAVLRTAGAFRRTLVDASEKGETVLLMRTLRDMNLSKFVAEDVPLFLALIDDLFPGIKAEKAKHPLVEPAVAKVINEMGLQMHMDWVNKIIQVYEMCLVRHSLMAVGPSGVGKTRIVEVLTKALAAAQPLPDTVEPMIGQPHRTVTMNPKAITSPQMFGALDVVANEWTEGIFAQLWRKANKDKKNFTWLMLDGPVDAIWIENMNTVMDDNKVLTLVSNERIPLTAPMRMIFEISHLRNASPATVSRAGVIFMNEDDVGWKPYVQMWVEGMGDQKTQAILEQLFEQFVTPTLDYARKEKWKHVTPLMDFAMVQVVCKILEGLLTPANCPPGSEKDVYEVYFQFATIWALGGAYGSDKGADFRKVFDAYWRGEFSKTTLKFPEGGLVFDYFIDPNTGKGEPKKLLHWNEIIPTYKHDRTAPYQTLLVPTMDTTRIKWLASMMLNLKKPVMLVGNAGSAKTVLLSSMLSDLDEDAWATYNISFNSFTEASDLQFMMEQPLEKKTGSTFGPPGNKRLVYFIDDINMSTPDKYGTQPPIALMRQQVDYGGFYDLKKLSMKKLENVQYVASMNPTSGSFFIIDRLQRHYATIATPFPDTDVLRHIYINIMGGHLEVGFAAAMRDALPSIVDAACAVHVAVADTFLPTAIKFHYQWNLRAMAGVFQGLINMNPATYKEPMNMARLWLHETVRVYGDRMTTPADFDKLQEILLKKAKDHLGDLEQEELLAEPNLFASFVTESDQKVYLPLKDWDHVNGILEAKLAEYNDNFAQMNLVLFNMAMEHLCRISRIIDNPRGNAMLVGVGGSGKQSLTRLAAFIGGYETFQMKLTATYGMNDFKDDLRALYTKVGAKSTPTVFLFTDQQIFKERCLVYFNDILAQGCPPDLFSDEDKDPLINAVRTEAKAAGLANDTRESLWGFFVDKVRANLHLVICMSPVGDDFRNRCRKFPALTNCTTIDWFFSWPEQALISVAQRFLEDVEMATPELRSACAHHMAFVHESVGHSAELYKAQERRNVYTTPKSFLELIDLYKLQLSKERDANEVLKLRLQDGLVKLRDAQEQVADMQVQLKEESEFVAQKKLETNALLEQVGKESVIADEQSALAAIEEEKVTKVQEDVSEFQKACYAELAAAEPAIKKAEAALNGLNKNSLTELKSLANPPAPVLNVTAAVQYMTAPKGTNLKKLDVSWAGAKKMMGSADAFLQMLQAFDKDGFLPENKEFVRKYTGPADNPNPEFNAEFMASKSGAAAGLCDWIVNICIYHDIYLDVEPKRQKLAEAEATLEEANTKLEQVRAQVKALEDRKAELQGQLEESVAAKNELEAKADATAKRANLAQRLVNGLYDEGVRWDANVATLDDKARLLVGNVLVASSFIAYIAPFNSQFRSQLVQEKWIPDSINRSIPIADGFEPMHLLSDASAIAEWRTEGLPADPLSSENAAIITKCSRFPLIIDPQLQAINWIAGREEPNGLVRLTLDQKNYLDKVVRALEEGLPMVIENMGEEIDAVLDNMIARAFIKKGSKLQVKLGDRDTDIMVQKTADGQNTSDPAFRLYMQTKLPNPDYIPEIQAQTTVVNFTVTEKGLEDQLLAVVVGKERPDLLEEQSSLIKQNNEFVIKLKELEDNLLYLLATAEGDILANEELIVSLEVTKATVKDINAKVEAAKITEASVAKAFESYRPNGNRGSLMYFIMNQLCIIDHMYQYSLAAFKFIFDKALAKAEPAESVEERVANLQDSITYTVFSFVTRGLFERHRLIFATQLAVKVLLGQTNDKGEPAIKSDELMLLIRNPRDNSKENPLQSWLPDAAWGSVQALASVEEFASLPADVEGSWKRWKEWCEFEQPEANPLPQEWKKLSGFHQLLIIRAMRPDRMTLAISRWVEQVLGAKYGTAINFDLLLSFEDSGPAVPIFFLLSPGVDPAADVRALGKTMGKTEDEGKFQGVSLGQGQEPVAEKALDQGYVEGGWVMLENIELVANWLPKLEKKLASLEEGAHPEFRVFLTAMPQKVVPVPILQKSIKLTNEPPSGLKANLLRAFKNFDATIWESSSKQGELKAIIFSLCFFHSVVCERRKFGPMGWNRGYPFNTGDLMVCIAVANNYLETNSKIPWDDLRYLFGEIMYGGHITDNWDRRLCTTFLQAYVREELVEGIALYPGFQSPPNLSYKEYLEYVEENIERETPAAYGLHPNSEINFMTRQAEDLFSAISELQPRGGGGEGGMTMGERVKQQLDEILEKLPELFLMIEIEERVEERTPYVAFFLQECERMNLLVFEMGRSLRELDAGLRGDLSISQPMEDLMNALFENRVPSTWEALAWPSLAPLSPWLADFLDRQRQLVEWTADLNTPKVTWISGLFNPQAFLTAVMQVTARKNEWPLDRVVTTVDVTKRGPEEIEGAVREGAYIYGMYMDGARWDVNSGVIEDANMKELYPKLPVMLVKAVPVEKADSRDQYACPVYKTQFRGPTYVFTAGLKTKKPPSKWVMAGVSLLMSVVE